MATYESNLVKKLTRHRGLYSGQKYDVMGRIFIPDGTVLATNDLLLGVPVGENQRIKEVTLMVIGDLNSAAGSVGYFQILGRDGNPAKVYRAGPNGAPSDQTFTSPTTDDDAYHAAETLVGYIDTTITASTAKLAGPVNIGVKITTGATVAADTEVFIGVVFDGETSTVETVGTAAPSGDVNDYLLVKA